MAEETAKLVIRLQTSRSSCAGAATAYLLRRLAARAGSYAPGIQEHIFNGISQQSNGATLRQCENWLRAQSGTLTALGYYVLCRRVAVPTDEIMAWVAEGQGFRGAVLPTDGSRLHNDSSIGLDHAIALTINDATSGVEDKQLKNGIVMVDPWPGMSKFTTPPPTLESAHRRHKYAALLLFWTGYS